MTYDLLAEPRTRWIRQNEVRGGFESCQILFDARVFDPHCARGIELQIAGCARSAFHSRDCLEIPSQRRGKETDTRVQVQCGSALHPSGGRFDQLVDEETIHLKESMRAHAKLAECGRVLERTDRFAPLEEILAQRLCGFEHVHLQVGF